MPSKSPIPVSKLVELEYNYIKETVHQSIEDRYRLLNFYIAIATAAGTVSAGLISVDSINQQTARIVIALLSFFMWLVGIVFLLMLIRLRQAWHGSLVALNKIKQSTITDEETAAFSWQLQTIPSPQKLGNIHFYAAVLISSIASIFIAACAGLLLSAALPLSWLALLIILVFFLNLGGNMYYYYFALSHKL